MMNRKFSKIIKRAREARQALGRRGEDMDKHGYEQDQDLGKTATEKGKCPQCGSPLSGQPPVCPKCGSEPFEKKEEKR